MNESVTETVTVRYVNPPKPGKKWGSIKTVDDEYIGCAPKDLAKMSEGNTYTVTYEVLANSGAKMLRSIDAGSAPATNGAAAPRSNGSYGKKTPEEESRMFAMGHCIEAGLVVEGLNMADASDIAKMIQTLETAWMMAHGEKKPAPLEKELNDEIPF